MPAQKVVLRSLSVAILSVTAALYAVQSDAGFGVATPSATTPSISTVHPFAVPHAPALPLIADTPGVRLPAQATRTRPQQARTESAFGLPCGLSLDAEAQPGAMVALDVMTPCQPGTRVDIRHGALAITAETDALGLLTLDVPALETPAFFTVTLPDGSEASILVGLPDLTEFDRIAVAWEGTGQLELHAIPSGASFGTPGHIWQEAPGRVADTIAGTGGALIEVGDPSLETSRRAQILTLPRSLSGTDNGDMQISIDAPITEETCGQAFTARGLRNTETGAMESVPITLTMPDCDALGGYLVLQNPFEDQRLPDN